MTIKEADQKFSLLSAILKKDKDHYLFIHFSKEDDYFQAYEKMDDVDTLFVIKELVERHKLNIDVLHEYLKPKVKL